MRDIQSAATVAALSLACATAAGAVPQGHKIGDTVECDGGRGKVVGFQARPGWDEPFILVDVPGSGDYQWKCLASKMKPADTAKAAPAEQTPRPATPAASLCRPGAKIEAEWGISWYEVTVKGPPDGSGRCLVDFDGYDPAIYGDMRVSGGLRPRGSGPVVRPSRPFAAAPAKPAAPASKSGAMRDGVYDCHKMSPGSPLMAVGELNVRGGRGSFKGMPTGWTIRSIRAQGADPRGKPLVVVDYTSAAGFNDRLDCVLK